MVELEGDDSPKRGKKKATIIENFTTEQSLLCISLL